MAKRLLHITLVDLGRGGEIRSQPVAGELARRFDLADIATYRSGHRRPFCQSRHFPSRSADRAHSFAVPCDAAEQPDSTDIPTCSVGNAGEMGQQQREGTVPGDVRRGEAVPIRDHCATRPPIRHADVIGETRPFGLRNLKLDWIRAVHLPERKRQRVRPEPVEATLSCIPSAGCYSNLAWRASLASHTEGRGARFAGEDES